MADQEFKRNVAYKLRIGEILEGKIILDADRFKFLEHKDKQVVRVNIIANIIDKYIQDDEKKFASVTLDDASGQIKLKNFGEEIEKFNGLEQGDTVQVIGVLRTWNNELYVIPEIIKKKDTSFLLIRKLESDLSRPKALDKSEQLELKEKLLEIIKKEDENGGADIDKMIMDLKSSPDSINQEIKKLLEEGIIYEPRPGKVRYLG